MNLRRRTTIVGALALAALAVYVTARLYSHTLVTYVVEQSLIQKAPPGFDPARIRRCLRLLLAATPGADARMARLLEISQYVEKVQTLTPQELEQLLSITRTGAKEGGP